MTIRINTVAITLHQLSARASNVADSLDDVEVSVLTETSTIPCASHEGPNSIELQLTCENPTKGEAVRISPTKADKRLIICEVEVNVEFPVAYRKPALQSSTLSANVASRSTDGVHDGPLRHSCSQTMFSHQPWWSVDLQSVYYVRGVKIYSGFKMDNFKVSVSGRRCFRYIGTEIPSYFSRDCNSPRKGQLVTIQVQSTRKHSLRICEVDVITITELPKMPKLSINPVAHARYLTLGTLVIVECEASVGLPRSQNTSVTIVVMKSSAAEQILVGPEHSRLVDDKTSTFNNTIDFNVDYSYNGAIFRCIASNAASPPRVTIANTIRYEITDCFKSATGCKNGAWCTMETGLCSCLQGYQGKSCTEDINECKLVPYPCHVNATCHNAIGSFKCRCKKGQVGNGQFCREENIKDKLKWLIPLVLLNIFFIPFIIGTFVFLRRKIRAKAKKKTTGTKTINRDYRYSILTAYRRPDPNAKILPDADTLRRSEECNNEQNKDKDDDDDDYDDDDN